MVNTLFIFNFSFNSRDGINLKNPKKMSEGKIVLPKT